MDLGTLDTKHPTYNASRWFELEALSEGGEKFGSLLETFLPQNPVEPQDVYAQRIAQAHYRSYLGSIVNLYVGWLFASAFSVKAYKRDTEEPITDVAKFYGTFQEDVGNETQLSEFMKERFREVLRTGESVWLIELPSNEGIPPQSAEEYEKRGLGKASLKPIERAEVFDWFENDKKELQWIMIHTCEQMRQSWAHARNLVTETWRIYDPELVHTFELVYEQGKRPTDPRAAVPTKGPPTPHGFKRVPVVRMRLPKELCIGAAVRDTQLEHFREENALSWLIRRTCYAQPIFNLEDGEGNPPRMGTGYAIVLGKDDKMGWTAPPVAPFDVLQKTIDNKRDEIYRIVHQMAQGLDNNAETVGRSAASKEIDAAATRIMLNTYGQKVHAPVEETYELISEARGEAEYEWSVEGLAGYDTATVASLIVNAIEANQLGIPSQTFKRELWTKTALALLPEVDQRVKDTIRAEISEADFKVTNTSHGEAQADALTAKAQLDRAKAAAEPLKAKASMISAEQPAPTG